MDSRGADMGLSATSLPHLPDVVVPSGAHYLAPVPAVNTIGRPVIERLLDQAPDHRVTVISAGPGWGKTTAVAQWMAATRLPADLCVGWLTLDPRSDNAASFWDGALRAIRAGGGVPAGHPLSVLAPGEGLNEDVLRLLHQGLATLPGRALLVIDDFHIIEDSEVLDTLTQIVSSPNKLSLVLITRVQPALPLHRLRLTGDLLELTSADLAFGPAEVIAVAHQVGVDLTGADAATVLRRTQGWPAGVRLAALHLSRTGVDQGLAGFTGNEHSVAEYLITEVLEQATPENRDFLLRTSICDPISADLAEEIVPGRNGQALLELLEARNEFVTALGADSAWFRYHPLLRELLQHTLVRDHPAECRDAHRAAGKWLARHGEPIRALEHAATAGDWSLFAQIYTTSAGPSLVGAHQAGLASLLREVPFADLPDSIERHLLRAGLDFASGRVDAIETHLDPARSQVRRSTAPPPAATVVLLEVLTVAVGWVHGASDEISRASRAAITALDAADPFPAAQGYRAIAELNLAAALLWSGDIAGARTIFTSALEGHGAAQAALASLGARGHLAYAELLDARLDSASAIASEVLDMAAARGWTSALQARPAHLTSAYVRLLQGDTAGADRSLNAGLAADPEPLTSVPLFVAQALLAVSQGRPEAARRATTIALELAAGYTQPQFLVDELTHMMADVALLTGTTESFAPTPGIDPRSPTLAASRARILLATGDLRGAQDLATKVTERGRCAAIADLVALVEAWLVRALAADQAGFARDASAALRRAVEIASPHRLVRPFLVTGSARASVLLRRLADGQVDHDPFLTDLLKRTSIRAPSAPEPTPLLEPLTGRELAVLVELPTMKSNAEIAAEYFVSVNTVKSHLKAIYRKLDVNSRRAAVHRARELDLLA